VVVFSSFLSSSSSSSSSMALRFIFGPCPLSFAGVSRQLIFYKLRISALRPTPNVEVQGIYLCPAPRS
jgi:hypothetical protein